MNEISIMLRDRCASEMTVKALRIPSETCRTSFFALVIREMMQSERRDRVCCKCNVHALDSMGTTGGTKRGGFCDIHISYPGDSGITNTSRAESSCSIRLSWRCLSHRVLSPGGHLLQPLPHLPMHWRKNDRSTSYLFYGNSKPSCV